MTHLGLGFNVISDSGAEALAGALQLPATQLSYLDLYGCKITSLGVEVLAGALRTNRSLIYLTLEETGISSSATALAEALQSNRTLTELNLCVNHIGNTEAIQLAQTLLDKNNTLAYLNLTDNRIGAKGKAELASVNQERCVIDFEDES
ncbi:protein NLRC3-like [Acropora muricata]|uniref:protein NLRC3-like n=1 Tax=Acropora muricata TaxID=159855 RepID=UPI0034E4A7E8